MKVFFPATALELFLVSWFLRKKPIENQRKGSLSLWLFVNNSIIFMWTSFLEFHHSIMELDCYTEIAQRLLVVFTSWYVRCWCVLWPCGLEILSSFELLWNQPVIFILFKISQRDDFVAHGGELSFDTNISQHIRLHVMFYSQCKGKHWRRNP